MKIFNRTLVAGLGLLCAVATPVLAQDFPRDTVRLIAGTSPGGGTDLIARMVANQLTKKWGKPVIVENMPGAANTIAGSAVATAAPDGHTLWVTVSQVTITPHTMKLPYDTVKAFDPVAVMALNTQVLVVNPEKLPVGSVDDLVEYAKAHPGELNYGSAGPSSPPYIGMQILAAEKDIEMINITYQGGAPAVSALLSGETELQMATLGGTMDYIKEGKLRPLAVSTSMRSVMLPDVPTMSEATGIADYDIRSWYGMFAPAGTPSDILQKINADVTEALETEEVKTAMAALGVEVHPHMSPDEMRIFVEQDITRWGELIDEFAPSARVN